jgi:hypothetical protein
VALEETAHVDVPVPGLRIYASRTPQRCSEPGRPWITRPLEAVTEEPASPWPPPTPSARLETPEADPDRATAADADEDAAVVCAPPPGSSRRSEPPGAWGPEALPGVAAATEQAMLAILAHGLIPGETIALAYQRKERQLRALFAALPVIEARALHRRLSLRHAGDPLAAAFARLLESRRGRLLDFLADARRREALAIRRS